MCFWEIISGLDGRPRDGLLRGREMCGRRAEHGPWARHSPPAKVVCPRMPGPCVPLFSFIGKSPVKDTELPSSEEA